MRKRVTIVGPQEAEVENKSTWYDRRAGLTRIVFEGELLVEVEDLERYVQVEFLDPHPVRGVLTHGLYTYRDDQKRPLEVGELVDVPTVHRLHNRAIVRKLGSNISPTAQTKHVHGRYFLEAEW